MSFSNTVIVSLDTRDFHCDYKICAVQVYVMKHSQWQNSVNLLGLIVASDGSDTPPFQRLTPSPSSGFWYDLARSLWVELCQYPNDRDIVSETLKHTTHLIATVSPSRFYWKFVLHNTGTTVLSSLLCNTIMWGITVLSHHLWETSAVNFSSTITLEFKNKTIPFLFACLVLWTA